jgi:hypothetical protein
LWAGGRTGRRGDRMNQLQFFLIGIACVLVGLGIAALA